MKTSLATKARLIILALFLAGFVWAFFFFHKSYGSDRRKFRADKNVLSKTVDSELSLSDQIINTLAIEELYRHTLPADLFRIGSLLRMFKSLRVGHQIQSIEDNIATYRALEVHLFSWMLPSFNSTKALFQSFSGRGIVVGVGSKYLRYAIHSIKAIRMHGCWLPVEIYYNGQNDLDHDSRKYLDSMKRVRTVDISTILDVPRLGLQSWDIKPFILACSSFSEVIMMDADTVFIQNPEVMFNDEGYVDSGALFFYDRSIPGFDHKSKRNWIESILPRPLSEAVKKSRYYQERTGYEQDSGVVVVDKRKNFVGALGACLLNVQPARDMLHDMTHGDKESFWLGFEMAMDTYAFIPTMSGSIGKSRMVGGKRQLCGKLLHFDREGALLWFNDGITTDKHQVGTEPFQYEDYGVEHPATWNGLCLVGEINPLKASDVGTLRKIISIFERDPLDMADIQVGSAMFNLGTKRKSRRKKK